MVKNLQKQSLVWLVIAIVIVLGLIWAVIRSGPDLAKISIRADQNSQIRLSRVGFDQTIETQTPASLELAAGQWLIQASSQNLNQQTVLTVGDQAQTLEFGFGNQPAVRPVQAYSSGVVEQTRVESGRLYGLNQKGNFTVLDPTSSTPARLDLLLLEPAVKLIWIDTGNYLYLNRQKQLKWSRNNQPRTIAEAGLIDDFGLISQDRILIITDQGQLRQLTWPDLIQTTSYQLPAGFRPVRLWLDDRYLYLSQILDPEAHSDLSASRILIYDRASQQLLDQIDQLGMTVQISRLADTGFFLSSRNLLAYDYSRRQVRSDLGWLLAPVALKQVNDSVYFLSRNNQIWSFNENSPQAYQLLSPDGPDGLGPAWIASFGSLAADNNYLYFGSLNLDSLNRRTYRVRLID